MSKKSERRRRNALAHERHGAAKPATPAKPKRDLRPVVPRSFAGTPSESDWVALRQLVPAATAPLRLRDPQYADRDVRLATLLPLAVPALVRDDGVVMVAVQTTIPTPDAGRDVVQALLNALSAEPGTLLPYTPAPADGPTRPMC